MSKIYVGNQLVKSPEHFQRLITEELCQYPVLAARFVSVRRMVNRLSAYSAMWQEDQPLLGIDQVVSLRKVLEDICGMLDLETVDRNFILGEKIRIFKETGKKLKNDRKSDSVS
jgi:hypothetical protein